MNIKPILSRLPGADSAFLKRVEANAHRKLAEEPKNTDARALLAAIDGERVRRNPPPTDGWTTGTQGDPRMLMRNEECVAVVRRFETHRRDNDGVYTIRVLGSVLPDEPRHIEEARAIAERAVAQSLDDHSVD